MTEDRVQSKSATLVVCYGLDQIKRDYPETQWWRRPHAPAQTVCVDSVRSVYQRLTPVVAGFGEEFAE